MAKRGGGNRQQNQPKQGASSAPAKPAVEVPVPPATQSKIDEILNESPATASEDPAGATPATAAVDPGTVTASNAEAAIALLNEQVEEHHAKKHDQHTKFDKFKNQTKKEN